MAVLACDPQGPVPYDVLVIDTLLLVTLCTRDRFVLAGEWKTRFGMVQCDILPGDRSMARFAASRPVGGELPGVGLLVTAGAGGCHPDITNGRGLHVAFFTGCRCVFPFKREIGFRMIEQKVLPCARCMTGLA